MNILLLLLILPFTLEHQNIWVLDNQCYRPFQLSEPVLCFNDSNYSKIISLCPCPKAQTCPTCPICSPFQIYTTPPQVHTTNCPPPQICQKWPPVINFRNFWYLFSNPGYSPNICDFFCGRLCGHRFFSNNDWDFSSFEGKKEK